MIHNGLSGCKLEIINDGVLRKYSCSNNYNLRLSNQVNKQILFSKFILKNISTPKVLGISSNDLYSFDMEYISGLSSYEYFSSSNVYDIEFVIQTLFEYFDYFSNNSRDLIINSKVIIDCTNSKSIAYDVIEIINDYELNAKTKNIVLEKINFKP